MDDSAAIWPAIAFVIVFAAIAIMIESAQSVGMFVGGILFVVVVGIILASRRRASERAHRRAERIHKRVEQQNIYEQAYNRVFAHVDKVIHRHQSVLIAKRRQKTYTDDYGRFIDEAWFKEMLYFYQNVVMGSELDPSINESTLARAASHARYKMPGIHADSSRQRLDAIIITFIDDTVQQLDQESSDAHVREKDMTPVDYERHCADLLAQAGWHVQVCGGSGDQGVDLVAERDGKRYVFQCKLHTKPVGNTAVQEVYTGMNFHNAHAAVVVSSAEFTSGARVAAEKTGVMLLHHTQLKDIE